jgi:hypothetical protein
MPVNHGRPYTDEAIAWILTEGQFAEMRAKMAKILGRTETAILQTYRWCYSSERKMRKFVGGGELGAYFEQILRVRAELGITL